MSVIWKDIITFFKLLRAVVKGTYKMPWRTFGWVVLCILYVLSPIDTLPDILPVLGFADDSAFVLFVLMRIHKELDIFRQTQQEKTIILDAQVIKEDVTHDKKNN